MSYWDQEKENLTRQELDELQLERLQEIVRYCYENVDFYKKKFKENKLKPEDIKSLEDVEKIPFTTKQDLRKNYPFGMLAVPKKKIVRIHASSGTTGKPTVLGYTRKDLQTWSELMARELYCTGVREKDTVQLIYSYSFFTGGFGFHQGAQKLGAAVIPAGVGNTKKQIRTMQDFGTTVFSSTPSYALYLSEVMEEIDLEAEDLNLRIGIFGAETWSDAMREKIEEKFGIQAFDNYGLSEMCGPGVCIECQEKEGMHLWEDHFLPEIIDPETGQQADKGELVLSTLTKEGIPLLRYRTKDLTSFIDGKCACGRTHRKIDRIKGRADDMLIIRGVNVFPSTIENIIMGFKGIGDNYLIIVDRKGHMDTLTIKIEVTPKLFTGSEVELRKLKEQIEAELRSGLDVSAKVQLVEPMSLERSKGKAQRVWDKRK